MNSIINSLSLVLKFEKAVKSENVKDGVCLTPM